ncbi:MAG TPA: ABC transporter permease subunit [Dehalococcoidia bacterium]|nr:ABC transporter permease subunit [Dehalococcoidia bacterium]
MTSPRNGAAGSIYDLGYRPYEGERLGRAYAVWSLYFYSLRAVFGLGRSMGSKVFPIGLTVIALIPASIQLAIAAIAPADLEFIKPEEYFSFVQIVVVLFCAVAAPEIIGRDQRNRTLPLYFSRTISRADYVSAKLGALVVALFCVVALPQVVLLLGGSVATDDLLGDLADHIDRMAPIIAGSAVVAVFMGSMSLAIASMTPRRAFATGAVLAYFVIFSILGDILVQTTTGDFQQFAILVSPVSTLNGAVYWIFNADLPVDSTLSKANLEGGLYFVAAVGYSLVAIGVLYRRFLRLSV